MLRLLLCIALLGGCGSPAATEPGAELDSGAPVGSSDAPAARLDTGRPADAARVVDSTPPAAALDARKAYAPCSAGVVNSQSCGHLNFDSKWVTAWKDGWPCVICFPRNQAGAPDFTKAQATACYVSTGGAGSTPGFETALCVQLCGECRE